MPLRFDIKPQWPVEIDLMAFDFGDAEVSEARCCRGDWYIARVRRNKAGRQANCRRVLLKISMPLAGWKFFRVGHGQSVFAAFRTGGDIRQTCSPKRH